MNTIHNKDCIELMKELPNECVDLIIADPPYYKAINEKWDKQWKTEEEYLNWCKEWFNECVRILKSTGVFYCYGNFDVLSKQKVLIFDKQLNFRQNITLHKGLRSIAGRTSDKLRMFPTATEYLLYYVKQNEDSHLENEINHKELRIYFFNAMKEAGYNRTTLNKKLGHRKAEHTFYTKSQWWIPTEEVYKELQKIMNLPRSYVDILNSFNKNRFTFNLPTGITDVWDFIPDKIRYGHKTQKPIDITNRIIKASSNENDLVYIPFAGSGSEIVSCIVNNRNYIATETNKEYIDNIIMPRVNTYFKENKLHIS
ncbi:site-specific DNA-methyltransferase [Clostridium botulinum]|nr:site-specific DNA-methyltransferase [Clostridium botulinum]